jgi:NADPH:quinone reductase-like Zn-dependent oxidoreductase
MNAALVEAYDRPPRYTAFADAVPEEGEVEIEVTAAALHPIVKSLANGSHYGATGKFPFIPGVDGAGRFNDGSRVYFGVIRDGYGTFAERAVAPSWLCVPIPDAIDDVTAAAMMNPGMSSWAALKARAQFVTGESILILGATGIAGELAVQIAKRLGAGKVIAAGRNSEALARAKHHGADATISLLQDPEALTADFRQHLAETKIDIVLDYLWGQPAECLLDAISQKGLKHTGSRIRYVDIGGSASPTITLKAATLRSTGLEMLGSGFGSASLQQIMQAVREFMAAVAQSPMKIPTKEVALSDIESIWTAPTQGARLVFKP